MGQGIYTSISMILAEELDANVGFGQGRARAAERRAVRQSDVQGADDRQLELGPRVLDAAAQERGAPRARCSSRPPRSAGKSTRRRARPATGEVVARARAAASSATASSIADASQHRSAEGSAAQGRRRLQADRQTAEAPRHARQDQRQGDVRHRRDAAEAQVRHARACPVFGGKVGHVDDTQAKQVPGVRQIVVLDDLVAVVGDHMWAAKQGLDALDITWNEGEQRERLDRDGLGEDPRRQREGRPRRQERRRLRQGHSPRARSSTPPTRCRSSRTRRWSRSTARCT